MADTYSATLGWLVMGIGGDNNTWGTNLNNSVFQVFEDAIAGTLTTTASGGQLGPSNTLDLSVNAPPAGASAARYQFLVFAGAITADQIVVVPNLSKGWWVKNVTSGTFKVQIKTPAGSAVGQIPQNAGWQFIHCDGNNVVVTEPFNSLQVQMLDGSLGAPSYSWFSEPNSGWRRAGSQDFRLVINGVDVLQVTGAGAATPSVVNVLSPNSLQVNGASVIQAWVASGGSADAITATFNPAIAALTDGLICGVRAAAANATTTPTFSPNGLTARTVTKSGNTALVPGDIAGAGHELLLRYNLAGMRWELLNPAFPAQPPIVKPQGRLTLVSGSPVMGADAIGAASVYYAPYEGNLCPVYNGTIFVNQAFAEQSLALVSNHVANNIYDVFAFLNNGVLTIATGPAWSNSAAGAGARGSGAGTTQLARVAGLLVNAVQITARNGSTTYTVPANQGTYLGSIYIDGSAGQVTCHFGFGTSRKFGVWNAFNRVPIALKAGAAGTFGVPQQASLAIWAANVSNTVFAGLAEEEFDNSAHLAGQNANSASAGPTSAIGWNSTSVASGLQAQGVAAIGSASQVLACTLTTRYLAPPALGINTVNGLAQINAGGWNIQVGGEQGNLLVSSWRG